MKSVVFQSIRRILRVQCARTAHVLVLALIVLSAFLPLLVIPMPAHAASPFTKLADPVDLPFGPGAGVAFSPDGLFLAVADGFNGTDHGATVYKRSGDTFTKVLDIDGQYGSSVAWSPTGLYLAVAAYESAPPAHSMIIYKRSGDTLTKVTFTDDYNSGAVRCVAFSPDGRYLAKAININNLGVVIYKVDSTLDTFTVLQPYQTLGPADGVTFSPDSTLMVVTGVWAGAQRPILAVLAVGNDTFTKLTDPPQPDCTRAYSAAFSPDGAYLAVAHNGADGITLYTRSGSTFAKATQPVRPGGIGYGVAFSRDSAALSLAHAANPYLISYNKWTDNIFTKMEDPAIAPTGIGHGVAYCPALNYMAVAHETSPFVTIYQYPSIPTPPAPVPEPEVNPFMGTGSSAPSTTATVTLPAPPVTNVAIQTSAARLSATSATPGTPITVTADITNLSSVNGNKKITLYVNGQVETIQGVTVNSGGSTKVTFNVSRSEPGDYTIYVDGVPAGSFKVEMVRESDMILIFSATLIAIAFLVGMVILWRRQRSV